ncbi:MAG: hypothetical protein NTW80_09280 [Deltaproteobacteria bacterium]|nr:hypothetical protein [Deltaproteobacteria bacterium]
MLIAGLLLVCLGAWVEGAAEAARKPRPAAKSGKYYQLYLRQGGKNIPLKQGDLTFKTALAYGDRKAGLYGLATPPQPVVSGQPLEIFVFDPESAAAHIRLSRLSHIDTAPAHTFDLKPYKIAPALFEQIYRVKYDDQVAINLWIAAVDIDLQITPVAGKPGWYRAVPEKKLEDGVYAVNFGLVQGPRIYAGEAQFYPFAVGPPPPPPVCEPTPKAKRRVAKAEKVEVCPPPKKSPVKAQLPEPAATPAIPELNAGFSYKRVSPQARREYQITNVNQTPWHNVNISIFMRSGTFPDLVLGPVSLYKDIVLPEHTVNQAPDKTFLEYETLDDGNCNLYLKIAAKEGVIKKAWKNVYDIESGESNLTEIPWDLKE